MSAVLKIVDWELGQSREKGFELRLVSERVTGRELISRRIADEVQLLNRENEMPAQNDRPTRSFLIEFGSNPIEAALNIAGRNGRKQQAPSESKAIEIAIKG